MSQKYASEISTLGFIYLVLILYDILSEINDTSQIMQEPNSMCITPLTGTKNLFEENQFIKHLLVMLNKLQSLLILTPTSPQFLKNA